MPSTARHAPARLALILCAPLALACPSAGGERAAQVAASCTSGGVPGRCVASAACAGASSGSAGICDGALVCCTPALAVACDPAAHPLPNAGLTEAAGVGDCPAGMVALSASLCIDRYEAALVTHPAGEGLSPYWNPGTAAARAVSLTGAIPQAYISQTQAAAACANAGKRLCSDAEWLRACRGAAGTNLWPHGATRVDGACNDVRDTSPVVELFGTSDAWIWAFTSHPCIDQLPASLARTGSLTGCASDEGVMDLAGNLNEWTSDPNGTLRGGSFAMGSLNGEGCTSATTAHDASFSDFSTGFRCCADLL